MADRPWTAVITSPFDGSKSKYNIPTVEPVPAATQPKKTLSVKQAKEQWASSVSKGVDYVRPTEAVVEEKTQPGVSPAMVQVRTCVCPSHGWIGSLSCSDLAPRSASRALHRRASTLRRIRCLATEASRGATTFSTALRRLTSCMIRENGSGVRLCGSCAVCASSCGVRVVANARARHPPKRRDRDLRCAAAGMELDGPRAVVRCRRAALGRPARDAGPARHPLHEPPRAQHGRHGHAPPPRACHRAQSCQRA